mmetsp:Transcript_5319/g.10899  ORF Transcript_5319/g.10899 Transcript_5319/m.10899 type:complete len:243 (+) Transcript_5319:621-1349(+)
MTSIIFSAVIFVAVCSFSGAQLSYASSLLVGCLFATFWGFLLPGLASMQDPIVTLSAKGTGGLDMLGVVPLLVYATMFQNIVPFIAKVLDYDRSRTTAALVLGSGIPVAMYIAFCLASLGGGICADTVSQCALVNAFGVTALVASSLSTVKSISEECESILSCIGFTKLMGCGDFASPKDQVASIPSVLLAVVPPLLAGIFFSDGEGFTAALTFAGKYGGPVLYGILPAVMVWNRGKKKKRS